ncbi:MAG: hypothetical protein LC800_01705 [Acidobacteria bacterium]|nr:hypothetical protein [Acidobacteriota bacterium]
MYHKYLAEYTTGTRQANPPNAGIEPPRIQRIKHGVLRVKVTLFAAGGVASSDAASEAG